MLYFILKLMFDSAVAASAARMGIFIVAVNGKHSFIIVCDILCHSIDLIYLRSWIPARH